MRARQPRRWMALMALVVGVFLIAACDPAAEESGPSAPAASAAATSTSASPTAGAAGGAASTGTGTLVDGRIDGMQMRVLGLERGADDIVTLRFELLYDGEDAVQAGQEFAERSEDGAIASGPYLVDGRGQQKYLVLRDAAGRCLCSELELWFDPGSSQTVFTQFPAPPEEVRRMTVYVPTFPPVSGVRLASQS